MRSSAKVKGTHQLKNERCLNFLLNEQTNRKMEGREETVEIELFGKEKEMKTYRERKRKEESKEERETYKEGEKR